MNEETKLPEDLINFNSEPDHKKMIHSYNEIAKIKITKLDDDYNISRINESCHIWMNDKT